MKAFLLFMVGGMAIGSAAILSVHEGNSLTQGQSVSNYVFQLSQRVNDANVLFTNIGQSGDTISNNIAATDTISHLASASNYTRTIATVEFGINDLSALPGVPPDPDAAASTIKTNFLLWIGNVRSSRPSTKIVMFTILGSLGIGYGSGRDQIRTNVNGWIRNVAPVDLVIDQASDPNLITNNPTYWADGTHPNDLGYFIMASNAWYGMNGAGYFSAPSTTFNVINLNISGSITHP